MNKTFLRIALCGLLTIGGSVIAQDFPLDPENWEVQSAGHVFENYQGKPSLYLFQGNASLKAGLQFFTGVIEYDIFVTERRGFPRVRFRVQDDLNYEEFYIRPHQSGNPDANQYTPVFNGLSGWQLYYGSDFSAPVSYRFNEWNHVKLVIARNRAEVYINDMNAPAIYVPELKRSPKIGALGLGSSGPSGFYFAGFKVIKQSNPQLKTPETSQEPLSDKAIRSWQVSESFPEAKLDKAYTLDKSLKDGLKWSELKTENQGYVNLARVGVRAGGNNTVFVKVVIQSDRKQIKKLSYGFSDRAKIYLNDQVIAGGVNNYASRDYRYLGTIGYFDHVYLPLRKGRNELWVAVSENFGGWGIMARFDDISGIKVD